MGAFRPDGGFLARWRRPTGRASAGVAWHILPTRCRAATMLPRCCRAAVLPCCRAADVTPAIRGAHGIHRAHGAAIADDNV
jgi:hypothetical protein